MKKIMQKRTIKNSGLTLIETLVAMSIFAVVISIAIGVFVSGSSSQKKILEFNTTQREAGYLMETISRELRMAIAISDGTDGNTDQQNNSDSSIEFTNYDEYLMEYCRSDVNGNCTDGDSGDYFARDGEVINSSDIKIDHLRFYVTDDFNQVQPIVTVSLKVKSVNQSGIEFTLQNSVSMRLY